MPEICVTILLYRIYGGRAPRTRFNFHLEAATALLKSTKNERHFLLSDPPPKTDAGKKESFKKAGIEYTINQIDQYRACGVDGIHLYALNKYDDVAYIAKAAGLIDLV